MWCSAIGCIVTLTLSMLVAPLTVEAQQAGPVLRLTTMCASSQTR